MALIERLVLENKTIEGGEKEYLEGDYFVLVLCERSDVSSMGWSRTKVNPFSHDFRSRHVIPLSLSEPTTAEEILARVKNEPEVKDCPLKEDHADPFIFIINIAHMPFKQDLITAQMMEIPKRWSE